MKDLGILDFILARAALGGVATVMIAWPWFSLGPIVGALIGAAIAVWRSPRIEIGKPKEVDLDFTYPTGHGVMARMICVPVRLKNVDRPQITAFLDICELNPTHPRPLFWAGQFVEHDKSSHDFDSAEEAVDHAFRFHFSQAGTWENASGYVNIAVKFEDIEGFYLPIKTKDAAYKPAGRYEIPVKLVAPNVGEKRVGYTIISEEGTDLGGFRIL